MTGCGGSGGPASYLATGASSADFFQPGTLSQADVSICNYAVAALHRKLRRVNLLAAQAQARHPPAPPPARLPPGRRYGRQATQQAGDTANSYIDQANADGNTAYAIANGLATGQCSGDAPGNRSALLKHI